MKPSGSSNSDRKDMDFVHYTKFLILVTIEMKGYVF